MFYTSYITTQESHTRFWGMGLGLMEFGKLATFQLKLGKIYIILMFEVQIVRLIPIVYLVSWYMIYSLIIRQYHNSGIILLHIFLMDRVV